MSNTSGPELVEFNGTYMPAPAALEDAATMYFDRADATPKLRTTPEVFAWLVRTIATWGGGVAFEHIDGKRFIRYPTAMGMVLCWADRECPRGKGFLRASPDFEICVEFCL